MLSAGPYALPGCLGGGGLHGRRGHGAVGARGGHGFGDGDGGGLRLVGDPDGEVGVFDNRGDVRKDIGEEGASGLALWPRPRHRSATIFFFFLFFFFLLLFFFFLLFLDEGAGAD